jgi:CPA2 family monovalent cation:H+ antiporter-2
LTHNTPLIATLAIGLGLAFVFGVLAHRLKISPLVGYLLAGVAVGPFTPGIVADQDMANQLAEIGVILLMFAVGLHFSLKDLMAVWRVAVPGSLGRLAGATLMGIGLAWMFGWSLGAGLVFGLALSVASTVVLVRALQERRIADTERGHIAMGWLIVEDLATIIVLVLLPALAPALKGDAGASAGELGVIILITFAKVGAFIAIMVVGGRRVIPWIMHYAAHTGSRELFRLAVYALALGVAFAASELFGVSFALGAFLAGMVMAESQLSQRAAEEALPLRDAFAVLFFVSVGMLFNPGIVMTAPFGVLAVLAIIVVGKSAVAFAILRAYGQDRGTALSISASLAQIGEFSFILVGLGAALGLLPPQGRDLVLAGAILSILINPVLFGLAERWRSAQLHPRPQAAPTPLPDPLAMRISVPMTALDDHDVVIGYGRVGSLVTAGLRAVGRPVLVLGDTEDSVTAARAAGVETVQGNAADSTVLAAANLVAARRLFVTVPEVFEAGQVVQQARAANPALEILARAHSEAGVEHLIRLGADRVIMAEREVAHRMLDDTAGAQVMLHPGLGRAEPAAPAA